MLTIFLLATIVQITYWAVFFGRFAFGQKAKKADINLDKPPVTVLICARNEAANLQKNLPKILQQHYPNFEILVVDDASEDKSTEILKELSQKHSNLRIIEKKEKTCAGKKAALALGIETAKYEWLLLTDADCAPASQEWIAGMMAVRTSKTALVLGIGPYEVYPEMINRWIRMETCYTALQYCAAAIWKIPYMGVGRNLLYQKKLYHRFEGDLNKHKDLASGDDDLFVNAAANKENTEICVSPKTFVFSEPKHSLKALYIQKSRHYSTGTRYKPLHQLLLGILSLSHTLFFCLFPFVLSTTPYLILLLFLLRMLIVFVVWNKILRIFGETKLSAFVIIFDLFLPIYYFIFASSLFLKYRSQWK